MSADGVESNGSSHDPHISDNAAKVIFASEASNLVPGDTNGLVDVFLKDLSTGGIERVSLGAGGVQGNGHSGLGDAWWYFKVWRFFDGATAISSDGDVVAFTSEASNLVPADDNGMQDVFARASNGGVQLISRNLSGLSANGPSRLEAVSGNGRFVLFLSWATDLIENSGPWRGHFYRFDRLTGEMLRVSVNSEGQPQEATSYGGADISDDGSIVVFGTPASNLTSGDDNIVYDVFVRDIPIGTTTLVSSSLSGSTANESSSEPEISGDGRLVMFHSWATDLVTNFSPIQKQVYLKDRLTSAIVPVSVDQSGNPGQLPSWPAALSADGRFVTFSSQSQNLVDVDVSTHTEDIFLRDASLEITEMETVNALGLPVNSTSDEFPTQNSPYHGQSSIASGGRFVAWAAMYEDSVVGDQNGVRDIFIRDRQARC